MVKLCQSPVNQSQPPVFVINHHVVRLNVSVHDAHAVTVVQCTQQLVQIAPDVVVCQRLVQLLEVGVVDVLKDEGGRPRHRVLDHAVQGDHVCTAPQIFKNLQRKVRPSGITLIFHNFAHKYQSHFDRLNIISFLCYH